MAAIFRTKFRA